MITAKECPILFNAPMVRAILAGDKTQTRRIIKRRPGWPIDFVGGQGDINDPTCWGFECNETAEWWLLQKDPDDSRSRQIPCPYGQVGDRLWVRESFWIEHDSDSHEGAGAFDCGIDLKTGDWASVCYCADQDTAGTWIGADQYYPERTFVPWGDGGFVPEFFSKRPNIHMPRWASRILLEITSVRVERLQDISEEDAKAEGAWPDESIVAKTADYFQRDVLTVHPSLAFRMLWEGINGAGSWEANPWVWVVEFRRIK